MAKTDKANDKKDWFTKIIIAQIIVCAAAIAVIFGVFKSGSSAAEGIRKDYREYMSCDYSAEDVSEAVKSVNGYISSFRGGEEESALARGGIDLEFSSLDTLEGLCLEKTDIGFKIKSPLEDYSITSEFGYRIGPISGDPGIHTGLDMAASYGTAIHAAADGVVVDASYDNSYGNYVKILHKNNTVTIYAHCSSLCVSEGDSVKQGDTVAKVGSTGASTGNHLHFEMRKNNIRIDPAFYLGLK